MTADPDIPPDRAVIDRIVDGVTAVLLVGPDETELLVGVDQLPDDAGEGDWVVIDPGGACASVVAVDADLTRRRATDIDARLARIRARRSGGRFGDR